MASLWSKSISEPHKDISDVADTGVADVGLPAPQPLASVPMGRPQLQRNQPQPPPPDQPPPPPAPQQSTNPNDSLSLMQLRRIVTEFPKIEPASYAFTYNDTATFEEEINEWFSYNDAEFKRLQRAKDTFERRWKKFSGKPWLAAGNEEHENFVKQEVEELGGADLRRRCKGLQTILYVILGVWDENAGTKPAEMAQANVTAKGIATKLKDEQNSSEKAETKPNTTATESQLAQMKAGIQLVAKAGGIFILNQVMHNAFKCLW